MDHRVRIFLRGIDSAELLAVLHRQTPSLRAGRYRDLQFVCDESYDVSILLNEMLPVRTPPERTICFLMEPPEKMRPQPHPGIGTLLSFNEADRTGFGDRFIHRHMLSFLHAAVAPDSHPGPHAKPKRMSMVVSGKVDLPLMRHRVALAKAILETDLPVDFYGRDFPAGSGDPRIRGPLPRMDKTAALRDYAYSIACECSPQAGYLTEKFLDCLINNCIPITNSSTAANHFPTGSFEHIDPSLPIPETIARLAALLEPGHRPDSEALFAAKEMVLNGDWSLAETIARVIADRIDGNVQDTPGRGGTRAIEVRFAPPAPESLTVVVSGGSQVEAQRTATSLKAHLDRHEPHLETTWLRIGPATDSTSDGSLPEWDFLHCHRGEIGTGSAWNRALSAARTPYLLVAPAGCTLIPDPRAGALGESVRFLAADERIGIISLESTMRRSLGDRSAFDGPFACGSSTLPLFIQNPALLGDAMVTKPFLARTKALRSIGPLREAPPAEDGSVSAEFREAFRKHHFVCGVCPEACIFDATTVPIDRSRTPNRKIPRHVSFIVPFRRDSDERSSNLHLVQAHLARCAAEGGWNFDVGIAEQPNDGSPFWKANLINQAARRAAGDVLALIDADALVPYHQLDSALNSLLSQADVCYPYHGEFLNVPREVIPLLGADIDLSVLRGMDLPNLNPASVGAAVLLRRDVFWGAGGMNERFVSWGREDAEFYQRLTKLGYRCARIPGPVYHLDHPRTIDSTPSQPHHTRNCAEFERIAALDRCGLIDEIATWTWADA